MAFCPLAVNNIESHLLFSKKGENIYSIGSLQVDKYIFLSEKQADVVMQAIRYMDGNNTIEEIQSYLLSEHYSKLNVYQLCGILKNSGLLEQTVGIDELPTKKEFNEIRTFLVTIKTFSLDKLGGLLRHIPFADVLLLVLLGISILVSSILMIRSPNLTFFVGALFSEPRAILYYFILSTASILLHEFSHAAIGAYYGLRPSTLTVSAYAYVSPMIYIKLPGIYFLPPKKRVITWMAGVITNLTLLLIAFSTSLYTSGELNLILITLAYCNLMIIIFSLNPILYSDGYYVFSTMTKTPNLRKSSGKSIYKIFTGKAKTEDVIYAAYFLLVVVLIGIFAAPQIVNTIIMTTQNIRNGMTVWEVLKNFSNILIMLVISIMAGVITKRRQTRENAEG